jgi:hypothetical protein
MAISRNLAAVALIGGLAFSIAPASAHHSYAMFDRTKIMEITGTIKLMQWTNPHVYAWLTVADDKGAENLWAIEFGGGPNGLERKGWTKHTLSPGDKVTFKYHPLKDGRNGGEFMTVTLADGTVMGPGGQAGLE